MAIECLEVFALSEHLHRQFLEAVQVELDNRGLRDINAVRASILLNIGTAEMTVSELMYRGCYLGSNVSYNLKKLTETGYVEQVRSMNDKRMIMVKNSAKGLAICGALTEMTERYSQMLYQGSVKSDDVKNCRRTLKALQQLWSRAIEPRSLGGLAPILG
ncbi:MAG: helix-turn-helix domain-containing protein [Caulobacteraceae bacterium]|nr:helix-turn-helix domain-containing protein [Caulobacteraceae bacterium]